MGVTTTGGAGIKTTSLLFICLNVHDQYVIVHTRKTHKICGWTFRNRASFFKVLSGGGCSLKAFGKNQKSARNDP